MSLKNDEGKKNLLKNIEPLSSKGWPKWAVYLLSTLSLIYLLNPTAGVIELIPDNLPLIGNIDEGAAALALWYGFLEIQKARRRE
ncbi:MAG: DUF1232 domain-containing protein [Anaerolineaceae bacterium]|nr:DUF1232 domain-containing protein [Anaerolineaceae bacterium]